MKTTLAQKMLKIADMPDKNSWYMKYREIPPYKDCLKKIKRCAENGDYSTQFILCKNRNLKNVREIVSSLKKEGFHASMSEYDTETVVSVNWYCISDEDCVI